MATRTTPAPPYANECSQGSANSSSPLMARATVSPENSTVRPAVALVRPIASGTSRPAARSSLKRLTISSE